MRPIRPYHAVAEENGPGLSACNAPRTVDGDRGYPEAAEIVGEHPSDIETDQPAQAAQRLRQPRGHHDFAKGRNFHERRILRAADLRVDLGQGPLVRRGNLLGQMQSSPSSTRAIATIATLRGNSKKCGHGSLTYSLRRTGSSLATNAKALTKIAAQPGGFPGSARASTNWPISRGRESVTNGTRIDARMRSTMKRRGSEIFLFVPRIVPLR